MAVQQNCQDDQFVDSQMLVTRCCTNLSCQSCAADLQTTEKPCPACRRTQFAIEYQPNPELCDMPVSCSHKAEGCSWSGSHDELQTHLASELDGCLYVDIKCPLNCQKTILKRDVDQHVSQHCSKRYHACRHCSFKATYEEVGSHMEDCMHVLLECPNRCGVTFKREFLDHHLSMCCLEVLECEFSDLGCEEKFVRKDVENHAKQHDHQHLSLLAVMVKDSKDQLQRNLQDCLQGQEKMEEKAINMMLKQDNVFQKQERKLEECGKKLAEQEKKLRGQEKKLEEKDKKIKEQEKRLGEQEKKFSGQDKRLTHQDKKLGEQERILRKLEKRLLVQEQKSSDQGSKQKEQEKQLRVQEARLTQQEELETYACRSEQAEMEENCHLQLKSKIEEQETWLGNYIKQSRSYQEILSDCVDQQMTACKVQKKVVGELTVMKSYVARMISNMAVSNFSNCMYTLKTFQLVGAREQFDGCQSPPMHILEGGLYKFCIKLSAKDLDIGQQLVVEIAVNSMMGYFDDVLKWPTPQVIIAVHLVNQRGNSNLRYSKDWSWDRPTEREHHLGFLTCTAAQNHLLKHCHLEDFVKDGALFIQVCMCRLQ